MSFRRPMLAVVTAGLMAVSLPNNPLNAAEADIKISIPKQDANEQLPPPTMVLIDPKKMNEKPTVEKIKKSDNRVVESDEWRKDTKDKVWKTHPGPVVLLNCTRDEIVVKTYNIGDAVRFVPRSLKRLKPGEHSGKAVVCGTKKHPDQCDFFIGTPKHGFVGWTGKFNQQGARVLFGSAKHLTMYRTTPTAMGVGCRFFEKYLNLKSSGALPK